MSSFEFVIYFSGRDDPRDGCIVIGEDTKPVFFEFETAVVPPSSTRTTVRVYVALAVSSTHCLSQRQHVPAPSPTDPGLPSPRFPATGIPSLCSTGTPTASASVLPPSATGNSRWNNSSSLVLAPSNSHCRAQTPDMPLTQLFFFLFTLPAPAASGQPMAGSTSGSVLIAMQGLTRYASLFHCPTWEFIPDCSPWCLVVCRPQHLTDCGVQPVCPGDAHRPVPWHLGVQLH